MTAVIRRKQGLLDDPSKTTQAFIAAFLAILTLGSLCLSSSGGDNRRLLRLQQSDGPLRRHVASHDNEMEGVVNYASAPSDVEGTLSQTFEDNLHEDPLTVYEREDSESESWDTMHEEDSDDSDDFEDGSYDESPSGEPDSEDIGDSSYDKENPDGESDIEDFDDSSSDNENPRGEVDSEDSEDVSDSRDDENPDDYNSLLELER
mmetsp:Transcript_14716/g.40671  ORF Transcript_14716/g.40671 Transcript_14716/m.40671 type:complete len:205 (+) Transcript_14716:94-708(+)|eukprot:CAMPEP_0168757132 /NCGR_PEP_ID=MMETSP0724-20121128/21002_1 /TAXON_ID=265536 /ORGANISM="Amphiprora sp., Strain CCMP467" /LENGTH=204 /DNA_ID=CAMNT_0008805919 /DNA_START=22 /DNA_END=636 /DNA_ORIENTATION=-